MVCGGVVDFRDVHVAGGAAAVAAVVGHVTEEGGARLLLADLGAHVHRVTWWRPARLGPGRLRRRRGHAHCTGGPGIVVTIGTETGEAGEQDQRD